MSLQFQYDEAKLVQALAFFSSRGITDLSKKKVVKLLFFADKAHLLEYGRPIIGDFYLCLYQGPIPSRSLNVLNAAIADSNKEREKNSLFGSILDISKDGEHPTFHLKSEANLDLDVFSKSDIRILEEIVQKYGSLTADQLSDESHKEACWKDANARRPYRSTADMPYESFFDSEHGDVLELALQDQAERNEIDDLVSAARVSKVRSRAATDFAHR